MFRHIIFHPVSSRAANGLLTSPTPRPDLKYDSAPYGCQADTVTTCRDRLDENDALRGRTGAAEVDVGGTRKQRSSNMGVVNYYSVGGQLQGEQPLGGARLDYLTDALGSVTATVDQTGTVQNAYQYKPYGRTLAKTGTAPDPSFLWAGEHGYRQTCRSYSDVYVRARHYASGLGRWTTRDPLGYEAGGNVYAYVDANPIGYVDPTGLFRCNWEADLECLIFCAPLGGLLDEQPVPGNPFLCHCTCNGAPSLSPPRPAPGPVPGPIDIFPPVPNPPPPQCPRTTPRAPSNCSDAQYDELAAPADRACKGTLQNCNVTRLDLRRDPRFGGIPCDVRKARAATFEACAAARKKFSDTCFGPPYAHTPKSIGHRIAEQAALNGAAKCLGPCPNGFPVSSGH